MEERQCRV